MLNPAIIEFLVVGMKYALVCLIPLFIMGFIPPTQPLYLTLIKSLVISYSAELIVRLLEGRLHELRLFK